MHNDVELNTSAPFKHNQRQNEKRIQLLIVMLAFATVFLAVRAIYFIDKKLDNSQTPEDFFVLTDVAVDDDINDVLALTETSWKTADALNFTATTGFQWIRFDVPVDNAKDGLLMRLSDPLMDQVDVYAAEKGIVFYRERIGDTTLNNRALALPNEVIYLPKKDSSYTVYLRGESKLAISLQLTLWSKSEFLNFNDEYTLLFGMLFGITAALTVYSLMIFATSQNASAFWYALYLLAFTAQILSISGIGYQSIWHAYPDFQVIAAAFTGYITLTILVKFTITVLSNISRIYSVVFNLLFLLSILITLALLIFQSLTLVKLAVLMIFVLVISMTILSISMALSGKREAWFFVVIWGINLASAMLSILRRFHYIDIDIEPIFPIIIGFIVQALVMALALTQIHSNNIMDELALKKEALVNHKEAVASKDKVLDLQKYEQEKLEYDVESATEKLEEALDRLSQTSIELERLRDIDGLTGLPNRLAFDNKLTEYSNQQAKSTRHPLTIAVVDLDHFKRINDNHGHLAGDKCLKAFAELLLASFKPGEYHCSRYGGEEFVIMSKKPLFEVKVDLMNVLQRCRECVIEHDGESLNITASFGVATTDAITSNMDGQALFYKADKALLKAKANGRDQIVYHANDGV